MDACALATLQLLCYSSNIVAAVGDLLEVSSRSRQHECIDRVIFSITLQMVDVHPLIKS